MITQPVDPSLFPFKQEMPILKNPRRERFAQAIAAAMFAHNCEAYRYATKNEKLSTAVASNSAMRWMKHDEVAARIAELRKQTEAKCRWEREDLVNFLLDICETPAGKITKDSRLCQSVEEITLETAKGSTMHRKKLAMPSKMEAAQSLKFMMGWDRPTEGAAGGPQGSDTLTELLIMIRRRSSQESLQPPTRINPCPSNVP